MLFLKKIVCSQNGDHPKEDLTKFDYKSNP
jgi:hypothetical protein